MDLFEYAEKSQSQPDAADDLAHETIYTVGEITHEIKKLILGRFPRKGIWIKGEISNYRGRHQSGHMYFRLKDEDAVVSCAFFSRQNRKLEMDLKEGMEVLAFGRVDVWAQGGNYQFIIEEIRPGGVGELYLRFEQLKKKLEAEGLFAPERKREIPEFPSRVGLITSATGAVVRDVIHVTRLRCPFVKILLHPVKVQGDGAKEEIAAAIEELNREEHELDVLIVGRGGGSIEDLWAFNEEIVARAIAISKVPTISAIGHQTDFTIADFVSDLRAATPSQAAELAVPNVGELRQRVELLVRNIVRELVNQRKVLRERLEGLSRSHVLRDPMALIQARAQRLDRAVEHMVRYLSSRKDREAERVRTSHERLRSQLLKLVEIRTLRFEKVYEGLKFLNPLSILARGFSVVTRKSGRIVKAYSQVKTGDDVTIRLHEGELLCQVKKTSATS